jgi:methyl-accepting chemotaxis protein
MRPDPRSQFAFLALLLLIIVTTGGLLNYNFMNGAETADRRLNVIGEAIESHLTGTFFNEEGRAILHSALGLYEYKGDEKKAQLQKFRVNNADLKAAIESYAKRAQAAVKANIDRPFSPEMKENFEKHLVVIQNYHAAIDKILNALPDSKEAFIASVTELNALRSKIGEFRKINSEALAKASADATAVRENAVAMQRNILIGTFVGLVFALGFFLAAMQKQFGDFGASVAHALADFKANRPLSVNLNTIKISEFAVVARSLQEMQTQSIELIEAHQREENSLDEKQKRLETLEEAVSELRHTMQDTKIQIDGFASNMQESAKDLNVTTKEASLSIEAFSTSSDLADKSVSTVANASHEMTTGISALSSRLRDTFEIITNASQLARETDQSVEKLDTAAQHIGEVISLIRSIAEQTNLLALNATIEAARAGESGRGFAVVASEVKELASRTAQATEDISLQISEIQKTTAISVQSIRSISEKVGIAEMHTQEMSVALDQQDSAIRDVAAAAEDSMKYTREMRDGTKKIENQIMTTLQTAEVVEEASSNVSKATLGIEDSIAKFLRKVAA